MEDRIMKKDYTIAVAGTGYVGLSIATLLSQHHKVMAVDIVKEKVDLINNRKSPIQDNYIEKYLAEKELNLTATLDAKEAYSNADFVVIAAPTNYDSATQHFDTSAVEAVIKLVIGAEIESESTMAFVEKSVQRDCQGTTIVLQIKENYSFFELRNYIFKYFNYPSVEIDLVNIDEMCTYMN